MAPAILLIAKKGDAYFEQVEVALLSRGFQTLSVRTGFALFERLKVEPFAAIVIDDTVIDQTPKILKQLAQHPIGAVTPCVVLQANPSGIVSDPFAGNKSLLDQTLSRNDITAEALADYLQETIKETHNSRKQGDLSRISMPFVLGTLQRMRFNGAIQCEQTDGRNLIYMSNGIIVFASSSNPRDYFTEFIRQRQLATDEQLKAALELAKAKSIRIGNALVQMQVLAADTLHPLLQEHLRSIICQPFSWSSGRYSLLPDEKPPVGDSNFMIPVSTAIYQGVKQAYDEARLLRTLISLDRQIKPNQNFANHLIEITFTLAEREMIKYLSKPGTLKSMTQQSNLTYVETLQICLILVALDICALQELQEAPQQMPNRVPSTRVKLHKSITLQSQRNTSSIESSPIAAVNVQASEAVPLSANKTGKHYEDTEPTIILPQNSTNRIPAFVYGFMTAMLLVGGGLLAMRQSSELWIRPLSLAPQPAVTVSQPAVVQIAPTTPHVQTATVETPTPIKVVAVTAPVVKTAPAKVDSEAIYRDLLQSAQQQQQLGQLAKAQAIYKKALQIKPNDGQLLVKLGNNAFDLDNEADALWYLQRALKINRHNADAHLTLGGIYLMNNQNDEALAAYQEFLQNSKDEKKIEEVKQVIKQLLNGES